MEPYSNNETKILFYIIIVRFGSDPHASLQLSL